MPKNSINRIVEVAGVIFVLSTSALESWHPWTHRPNTSAYEVWVVQMIISYHILSYLFISIIHTQKNTSYPRPILWSLGVCPWSRFGSSCHQTWCGISLAMAGWYVQPQKSSKLGNHTDVTGIQWQRGKKTHLRILEQQDPTSIKSWCISIQIRKVALSVICNHPAMSRAAMDERHCRYNEGNKKGMMMIGCWTSTSYYSTGIIIPSRDAK